jgi:hypothetical protein
VPLELGGANEAANLWPEAGPVPNPKDSVERTLPGYTVTVDVTVSAGARTAHCSTSFTPAS